MTSSGKELEDLVRVVESVFLPIGFNISTREKIFNDDGIQIAELDVIITGTLGTTKINWLIECRDRPSDGAAPGSWIEQLVGRRERFNFNKVTAVSTTGFSPGAIDFAKDADIELRAVEEITQDNASNWFSANNLFLDNLIGDLKNANININNANEGQKDALKKLLQNSNSESKIFFHTDSREKFNLKEIWREAMKQIPNLGENVGPNSTPRRKKITVNYRNPKSRYMFMLQDNEIHIEGIVFTADISISRTKIPISKITQYSKTLEKEPIADSIHFDINVENEDIDLALHKVTNQTDARIIATAKVLPKKAQNDKE